MKRVGAFLLGLAFVLLIADVVLGVLEFIFEGPDGPLFGLPYRYSVWTEFYFCCLATAGCAVVGGALLQVAARRDRARSGMSWLAAAAVSLAALHICAFTWLWLD